MFIFYEIATGDIRFTMDGESYPAHLVDGSTWVLEVAGPAPEHLHDWLVVDDALVAANREPSTAEVTAERDRRMQSPFPVVIRGTTYMADCDEQSLARITGAATLAGFAAGAGAPAGYLYWANPSVPFRWIMHDNSQVEMDALETFAFGQAAAAFQSAHIFAADALKHMVPIPSDYKDDGYWP